MIRFEDEVGGEFSTHGIGKCTENARQPDVKNHSGDVGVGGNIMLKYIV